MSSEAFQPAFQPDPQMLSWPAERGNHQADGRDHLHFLPPVKLGTNLVCLKIYPCDTVLENNPVSLKVHLVPRRT